MGKNKKENFIFTLLMAGMMVFCMISYNMLLENTYSNFWKELLIIYFPALILVLILEWFIVSRVSIFFLKKFVNENDSLIKRILIMSTMMVLGMCTLMSLITFLVKMPSSNILEGFILVFSRNLICALPLQLFIVGPFARFIFIKLYPPQNTLP